MSKIPVFLQSELADCGLACLAMASCALGQWVEPAELRSRNGAAARGNNLRDLMLASEQLGLLPRAIKCELSDLERLDPGTVLHWDFNHFVVLEQARNRSITIIDPALGRRKLTHPAASAHFTGVALELRRGPDFRGNAKPKEANRWTVLGMTSGWTSIAWHLLTISVALEIFVLTVPLFTQMALDNVITSSDSDLLVLMVIGFTVAALIQAAIGTARGIMIGRISHEIRFQWTSYLFQHVVRLPVGALETRSLGDLLSRFKSIEHLQRLFATTAVEGLIDGIAALVLLALMAAYSPLLCSIVVASFGIYAGMRWASYRWFRDNADEQLMLAAREQGFLVETFRAMVAVKLYGGESRRTQRWQNIFSQLISLQGQSQRAEVFFRQAGKLTSAIDSLAVIGWGVAMVLKSSPAAPFTVGMLMAFLAYRSQFSVRVTGFTDFLIEARLLKLHDQRLAELLALEREPLPRKAISLEHLETSIELRGVGFRFGSAGAWVLRNCNLKIAQGEHLVLVGPSGGGKTTLLKILLGLLEPAEGEVLVGGVQVVQVGQPTFRTMFGAVMQDDVLLSGSIIDNVAFESDEIDSKRVEECCRIAQVHSDIARLPMGYHTLVGEFGASFSGGQRQRIMIARALYKQPRILAFDEATSHLDIATEVRLAQALSQLEVTRISIAHRPETIRRADRIIEVVDGTCFEIAPHTRKCTSNGPAEDRLSV